MKIITVILTVLLAGCEARVEYSHQPKEPDRFTVQSLGVSLFLIRDTQTGKEYLSRSQGGFIEVEPTKKP